MTKVLIENVRIMSTVNEPRCCGLHMLIDIYADRPLIAEMRWLCKCVMIVVSCINTLPDTLLLSVMRTSFPLFVS